MRKRIFQMLFSSKIMTVELLLFTDPVLLLVHSQLQGVLNRIADNLYNR